ncbi:MAG: hypothetical protein ABIB79_01095 [archaeon]
MLMNKDSEGRCSKQFSYRILESGEVELLMAYFTETCRLNRVWSDKDEIERRLELIPYNMTLIMTERNPKHSYCKNKICSPVTRGRTIIKVKVPNLLLFEKEAKGLFPKL